MRSRNNKLQVYLNDKELKTLELKANKSGKAKAEIVRCFIMDKEVKEIPSKDFFLLNRDVKRIGSNIEQLLRVANSKHFIDAPMLRKTLDELQLLLNQMWAIYVSGDR